MLSFLTKKNLKKFFSLQLFAVILQYILSEFCFSAPLSLIPFSFTNSLVDKRRAVRATRREGVEGRGRGVWVGRPVPQIYKILFFLGKIRRNGNGDGEVSQA